jgi:gliding motility-associated-like protein
LCFSNAAITAPSGQRLAVTPQLINDEIANPLTDKNNWTKFSGTYVATGTESYITIGNFNDNASTDTNFIGGGSYPGSYYYIDDVSIVCKDCDDTVSVPNVFTPNHDNKNDFFEIKNLPADASTQIFNRWGIKVFETNKSSVFWDGRITSGLECPEGTYFYIITTSTDTYKGFVQLVH